MSEKITKPQITANVMLITPQQAEEWLDGRRLNRPVKEHVVAQYLREMRLGNWEVTNQGIGIDSDGHLVDGQHRLTAITRLGRPVWMLVTGGVSHDVAIRACDSGPSRTGGQRLAMQGEKAGALKAAISRAMFVVTNPDHQYSQGIPHSDVNSTLEKYRGPIEAVELRKMSDIKFPAITRAVAAIMIEVVPEVGVPFWESVSTGADLGSGDPRLAFRNWIAASANAAGRGKGAAEIWAKTISTADAFMHDESLHRMSSSARNRYLRWARDMGLAPNRSLLAAISSR